MRADSKVFSSSFFSFFPSFFLRSFSIRFASFLLFLFCISRENEKSSPASFSLPLFSLPQPSVDWSTGEVDAPLLSWYLPIAGIWPYSKDKEAAAQAAVKKALSALDAVLASRTYLVGDHVTLADVVGACNLWLGFTKLFDASYRASVPNVSRWFDTLVHQPAFAKVLGDVSLAEKAAVYDAAAAKKAAEAPKAAPAAAAPAAAAAAAGAADPSAPAAPKPKNPLDLLPPSPMALDSWKRLYSNTPAAKFREICIEGLWKGADVPNSPTQEHFPGFDPEGFSIWFCDYK